MPKIYRWAWKSIFGYLPIALYFGFFSVVSGLLAIDVLKGQSTSTIGLSRAIFLGVTGAVPCMFGVASLFFLIMPFIQVLFGYLKVSPTMLEYRRWPFGAILCRWDEIESVQQGTLRLDRQGPMILMPRNLKYATLLIRRSRPGREIPIGRNKLGSAKYHFVPLSEFEGWSDGSLEIELRTYAPHAFKQSDRVQ